jgi:hypothetical protein
MTRRLLLPALAGLGLAGCVAYPAAPPPPRPVYAGPPPGPVYAPPPPAYAPPPPRRQRVWVPRRCDAYGRCRGGRWVWR